MTEHESTDEAPRHPTYGEGVSRSPGELRELLRAAPDLLTRQQVSRIAGVSLRTVDRWRADGRVTTVRGRRRAGWRAVWVPRDSLATLLLPQYPPSAGRS